MQVKKKDGVCVTGEDKMKINQSRRQEKNSPDSSKGREINQKIINTDI